jgi:MFS transporter, SP family, sugar:H+ symporter
MTAEAARVSRGPVVLVAGSAALGGFLFGYDTAVINGTVDAIQSQFHMSNLVLGFVVSSALLGSAVGAWFAGPLADRMGRIRVMVIAATLFAISATGSGLSFSAWELTIWRVMGGLAIGAASVIAPAYIAEMSPREIRGRLGSLQQLAIVSGIFASLLIDYAVAQAGGGSALGLVPWGGTAWRWMFISAAIPAIVYGVLALQIPESPRYLVRRQRQPQARQILAHYVGGDVDGQVRDIEATLAGNVDKVHLRDLRGPRFGLLPIVWVGILLSVFQQFVGINVIFYYSTTLWHAVGFSESSALLTSVITSVTNILTTLIAIALIDKIGRKPLLLIGAAGMVITLGTMAICFSTATGSGKNLTLSPTVGAIALVAANLYVVSFGMSWGPVVWVLLGEMFNNVIRATALAVSAAAQWLANWVISTSFPSLASVGLFFAYGLYTLFALLAFIFVWRGVRETKGRALEEM